MFKRLLEIYKRRFWSPEKYARYLGVNIGIDCSIATKYWGSEPYLIEIGDHVQVTNDVRFFNHGGSWVFRKKYPLIDTFGKIKIGDNVYIGNCAMIMPGVSIGNDVVIGAGSIITKSIPSGKVVAGNPAKIIGSVSDLEDKMVRFNINTKAMSACAKKNVLICMEDEKFIKK